MAKKPPQESTTTDLCKRLVDVQDELVALKKLMVLQLRVVGVSPAVVGKVLAIGQAGASRLTPGFKKPKPPKPQ